MTFDFIQYLYKDLPPDAGIYVVEVKGGKKYIGQSTNVRSRIHSHMRKIFDTNEEEKIFYKQARKIIKEYNFTKEEIDRVFIFQVMKTEQPEFYEQQFLSINQYKKEEYYNVWWGSQHELNKVLHQKDRKMKMINVSFYDNLELNTEKKIELVKEIYIKEETVILLQSKSKIEKVEFLDNVFGDMKIENTKGTITFLDKNTKNYIDKVDTIRLKGYLIDFFSKAIEKLPIRKKVKNFLDGHHLSEILIDVYKEL